MTICYVSGCAPVACLEALDNVKSSRVEGGEKARQARQLVPGNVAPVVDDNVVPVVLQGGTRCGAISLPPDAFHIIVEM